MPALPAPHRIGVLVTSCLLLCQCTHQPPVAPRHKVQWQVVGHDPLTYAPKGFNPPETEAMSVPEYVYLADRQTRFYIPPRAAAFREAALATRADSLKLGPEVDPPRSKPAPRHRQKGSLATQTACLVYRLPATAMFYFVAYFTGPHDPSAVEETLDCIWGRQDPANG